VETCKEQLLYEIQGKYYYNSDVTAVIDGVTFTQEAEDRVRLSGVTGLPPPPTTKAGITAEGGFMVSANWAVVGLDIEEKKALFELQLRHMLGKELLGKLSHLEVQVYGSVPENPKNQNAATVDMRLVLQARERSTLSLDTLFGPVFSFLMQSFPAATFTNVDINPKPVSNQSRPSRSSTNVITVPRILPNTYPSTVTNRPFLERHHRGSERWRTN
jgi:hypothetical protein